MNPRPGTAVTLLILAGLILGFIVVFRLWLRLWYGQIRPRVKARFLRGKLQLTANCDAWQAKYDPAEVDYDDPPTYVGEPVGSERFSLREWADMREWDAEWSQQ